MKIMVLHNFEIYRMNHFTLMFQAVQFQKLSQNEINLHQMFYNFTACVTQNTKSMFD